MTTKEAIRDFLRGLDTNDRSKLRGAALAAFDQYVTELPGPDAWVKDKMRPYVETAIDNLINDWCS